MILIQRIRSSNNGTIFKANIWGIRKRRVWKTRRFMWLIEYNNKTLLAIAKATVYVTCMEYG